MFKAIDVPQRSQGSLTLRHHDFRRCLHRDRSAFIIVSSYLKQSARGLRSGDLSSPLFNLPLVLQTSLLRFDPYSFPQKPTSRISIPTTKNKSTPALL